MLVNDRNYQTVLLNKINCTQLIFCMSLQDLQLTPLMINELYRDFLVDINDPAAPLTAYVSKPQPDTVEMPITEPIAPIIPPPARAVTKQVADTIAENEQVLFQTPVAKTLPVQETTNARIKFLGGNKKRIAFIVNCTSDVFLPDAQLEWLKKMLEACRLNLGDIAIANSAKNEFTIADIKQELFSTTVILLGAEPSAIQLPINFPHFNLQQHDGIVFLSTPPPAELNQNTTEAKLLKSKLWVSLQKLFKL